MKPREYWRATVDQECPAAIPDHALRITSVALDEDAIRVAYEITPELPSINPDTGRPWLFWTWWAEDDLGNRYDDVGGAYGTPPGEEKTEGVLSLAPLPLPGARSLRVFMNPLAWSDPEDAFRCSFDVDLTEAPIGPRSGPPPHV